jgi:hypothetical protein
MAPTPTSTVSGLASPRLKPTGIKSHPTWGLMAKSAGRANCGGILPLPISTPTKTPTTCAITAPGPNKGESMGIAHTIDIANRPGKLPAKGEIMLAIQLPIPDLRIIPIRVATKAINGRMFLITWSIVSRPD